jgi:hypothetical protein
MSRPTAHRRGPLPLHALCRTAAAWLLLPLLLPNCTASARYTGGDASDVTTTPIHATTTIYPIGSNVVLLDTSSSTIGDTTVTSVELSAVDPVSGSTLWELTFEVEQDSRILALHLDERGILLGINDELHYFDANDGRPRWTRTLTAEPQSQWQTHGRRLYGTAGTQLVSFSARSGRGFSERDLGRGMVISDVGDQRGGTSVLLYESSNPSSVSMVRAADRSVQLKPLTLNGTVTDSLIGPRGAIIVAYSPLSGSSNELHLIPTSGEPVRRTVGAMATCYAGTEHVVCFESVHRDRAPTAASPLYSGGRRLMLNQGTAFAPSDGLEEPAWSVAFPGEYGVSSMMTVAAGLVTIDNGVFHTLRATDGHVLSSGTPRMVSDGMNTCTVVSITATHVVEGCYGSDTPVLRARRMDFILPEEL